jgi:hypothetical protein
MSDNRNLPVDISKKWEEQATKAAAEIPATGGTFLSTKGGILTFGEEKMPGNQVCVIVLDAILENTAYEGKYGPDSKQPPRCYAFGRLDEQKEMAPHPSMDAFPDYFVPQSESCATCPLNEYGSAETGRGKACKNRARLAILPAGYYMPKRNSKDMDLEIFTDPAHFKTADIAQLKLPVLSVKNYFKFVSDVAATHRRPPHGVIARVFIEPDEKAQFKVCFEMLEVVPNEIAEIIMERHDAQMAAKIGGYQPPQEKDQQQQNKPAGLRGLRRA